MDDKTMIDRVIEQIKNDLYYNDTEALEEFCLLS